ALGREADVVSVETFAQARQALANGSFDLTLLDLTLDDKVDLKLLSELHDRDGRAIPVVVFSGRDADPEVAAWADATLVKSQISIDHLVGVLRGIVARKDARRMVR